MAFQTWGHFSFRLPPASRLDLASVEKRAHSDRSSPAPNRQAATGASFIASALATSSTVLRLGVAPRALYRPSGVSPVSFGQPDHVVRSGDVATGERNKRPAEVPVIHILFTLEYRAEIVQYARYFETYSAPLEAAEGLEDGSRSGVAAGRGDPQCPDTPLAPVPALTGRAL